ncbi:MAG: hypothetical protein KDB23_06605, partial [Planctomycetales bacterium]|nr:hypothetical protein [Planctomycetales bacterium]
MRFRRAVESIERAHRLAVERSEEKLQAAVADWLLDNFYIVKEQLRDIQQHLPPAFFRELPKLRDGKPRVYKLAYELASHCDCALDEDLIVRFVSHFQHGTELTIGETWAFPIMLRVVMVEELGVVCDHLIEECERYDAVHQLIERATSDSPGDFAIPPELNNPAGLSALYTAMNEVDLPTPFVATFDRTLSEAGTSLTELRRLEQHRQATSQVSIANIITSMRLLAAVDWIVFFEAVNQTEGVLRRDPAGVYPRMDFPSRNRYRDAVERISKNSCTPESEIARAALERSEQVITELGDDQSATHPSVLAAVQAHIGYWLVDDGVAQLEDQFDYRPKVIDRCQRLLRKHPQATYFGGLVSIWLALMALLAWLCTSVLPTGWYPFALWVLLSVPVSDLALAILNVVLTRVLPVRILPKIDFRDGVNAQYPTLVVVPCMLSSASTIDTLLSRLENHFLANSDRVFSFALLTDFVDSNTETQEGDGALLQQAVEGIRQLNQRYDNGERRPFFLFNRVRRWNPAEQKWMGWERKRGKLIEFGQLLAGSPETSYTTQEGDLASLAQFRNPTKTPFIITLDSDTILPRGAARRLVGAMAHPLNRPLSADENSRCLARGYSILQPRVGLHLVTGALTRFAKVHSHSPGIDPYVTAASDVYQDLFAEGSFTGKGILDLRSFELTLEDAFPENQILSHDLIEGCHGRVALVSDIEVYDNYPSRYDADAKRHHRWARGDWQLLPWIFPTVPSAQGRIRNRLDMLSRWKIVDNLRRSVVAPLTLAFLTAGWLGAPQQAWMWTTIGFLIAFHSVFIQAVTGALGWTTRHRVSDQVRNYLRELRGAVERAFYATAFLPYTAWLMIDAIVRTLYRTFVSRRHLLEWETAAAAESRLMSKRFSVALTLSVCSLLAATLLLLLPHDAKLPAAPWLIMWAMAPFIGQSISTLRRNESYVAASGDETDLTELVAGTWGFFEQFVTPNHHWLPPDNVQESPAERVAARISPTNEGLFLVSGLIAHEFGLITLTALTELLENNLRNWWSLPQLNGHHFNWYDTSNLRDLHPRYVSTVDSGNLMACYLTLQAGLRDATAAPILHDATLAGVKSSLRWLSRRLVADQNGNSGGEDQGGSASSELITDVERFHNDLPEHVASLQSLVTLIDSIKRIESHLSTWIDRHSLATNTKQAKQTSPQRVVEIVAKRLNRIVTETQQLMPWLERMAAIEAQPVEQRSSVEHSLSEALAADVSLDRLIQVASEVQRTHGEPTSIGFVTATNDDERELLGAVLSSGETAARYQSRLNRIAQQCEAAAAAMDFRFLYNTRRKLFSIGYDADTGTLDRSHYDLLCSECRLASYLAIAKGDVDTEHWFRLGRQSTSLDGKYSLLSWGGTMFEFLMPQLFQQTFAGSLIATSCHTAIDRQITYGQQKGVPWGISESAYAARAANADYQYRSFGVPGLGLKGGLAKDLVVSPYSTALALPLAPERAARNLQLLSTLAAGDWGLYDAVDYTPRRQKARSKFVVVQNYMAHHHGMTLLAFANSLKQGLVQRWFHAHPLARANELLLQERTPIFVDESLPTADEVAPKTAAKVAPTYLARQIAGVHTDYPKAMVLGNGDFSSLITHTGGGYLRHGDTQVTRWRADTTVDDYGLHLYVRDVDSSEYWSATYQPTRVHPDQYETRFAVDKAEIRRRQGDIETTLEVTVSPEHNAEVRQLIIVNHSDRPRTLELTSYAEVALTTQAADVAHPAFQKLFVQTRRLADQHSLLAWRRPRDSQAPQLYALHTLALPSNVSVETLQHETSREAFIGRGNTLENPRAIGLPELAGNVGAVLDAVFALRCRVTIGPNESVKFGLTTATAGSVEEAESIADLYRDLRGVQRAFELAWAFAQAELRSGKVTPRRFHTYQQLASMLLYPRGEANPTLHSNSDLRLGQSTLWKYGISGDLPILAVHVEDENDLAIITEVLDAQAFLRAKGMSFDVVICNDYPGAYYDAIQDQLTQLLQTNSGEGETRHAHIVRSAQIPHCDRQLIDSTSSVLLPPGTSSLAQVVSDNRETDALHCGPAIHRLPVAAKPTLSNQPEAPAEQTDVAGEFNNGLGQFVEPGQTYEIELSGTNQTPTPWSNVIANPHFGTLVTDSGGGYTWSHNSREYKLSSWSNDPVVDPPAEMLYLTSLEDGRTWSPLRSLDRSIERVVRHGQGFTQFVAEHDGLRAEVQVTVDPVESLKLVRVRLHNPSNETREVAVAYYVETVLGTSRSETQRHLVSTWHAELNTLSMVNGYHPDAPNRITFLTMHGPGTLNWSADRRSFLGRNGTWQDPCSLGGVWSQTAGAGLDPCLAIQRTLRIEAGDTQEMFVVLGTAENEEEFARLVKQCNEPSALADSSQHSRTQWNEMLSSFVVETPNRAFDILVNRWLPYQMLSCRIWGRSAFYQSGGAYGFRDQLQDVLGLLYHCPEVAREHILRAAARQYQAGDVQHWWHPPLGKGTRTRFSDDFLFLPYAVARYIEVTGDRAILQEHVSFIHSPQLRPEEHERYELPQAAGERGTLLEHCVRALKHGLRYGVHGLPLMGCGDWNDGLNRVGIEGKGESIWVAWFQMLVFRQFATLLTEHDEREFADTLHEQATRLQQALDAHAWDGAWYRRAYFDDGTPLGSAQNDECQIDSLAQSWAVIAGGLTPRSQTALRAALDQLFDPINGMILLFTPPFNNSDPSPGY